MPLKNYNIGIYEKALPAELDWRQKFKAAREAGYDFFEISIDETEEKLARLDYTAKERRHILDLSFDENMPVRTMCLSAHRKYPLGSEDAAVRARSLEIAYNAINLAGGMGIRIIQLAGYDVYYTPGNARTRALFYEGLRKVAQAASAAGVVCAFETMETDFMNTCVKAMEYVKKVNSMYLGVYPDSGNITNAAKAAGASEIDDLKSAAGHIAAVHLKESVPGKFREIPYGTGHVDFKRIIQTSLDLGVRLFVTEFWHKAGDTNYAHTVKMNKDFIDDKFKTAQAD